MEEKDKDSIGTGHGGMPDGRGVAAILPPGCIHRVALTIRKFSSRKFEM